MEQITSVTTVLSHQTSRVSNISNIFNLFYQEGVIVSFKWHLRFYIGGKANENSFIY